jgi:hypothetical protein
MKQISSFEKIEIVPDAYTNNKKSVANLILSEDK